MAKLFAETGCRQTFSAPYDPQGNGISERSNRILLDLARTNLIASSQKTSLWNEAVLYACQILNATTVQKETGKSAFEIFHNKKPFFGKLFPFGTVCYFLDQNPQLRKLQPRGKRGLLVGLNAGIFGYRIWEPGTRRIVVTRHVTFSKRSPLLTKEAALQEEKERGEIFVDDKEISSSPVPSNEEESSNHDDTAEANDEPNSGPTPSEPEAQGQSSIAPSSPPPPAEAEPSPAEAESPPPQPSTSTGTIRKTKRRDKKKDVSPVREKMVLRDRSTLRPIERYVGLAETYVSNGNEIVVPETYEEAVNSPQRKQWLASIKSELDNMDKLSVWTPSELPPGRKALDSRWLFRLKVPDPAKPRELVFKSRLCIRGFRQRYGTDYDRIYAPTCRFEVIRLLLSIAVKESLCLFQADVACAFLRAPIDREIYIERPEGYKSSAKYFRLLSSIYGLHQSPRCFYKKMREVLASLCFTPSEADPCVFIGPTKYRQTLVLYVDDCVLMSNTQEAAVAFLEKLGEKLEIKYRPLNCFLGIEIQTLQDGLFLHQTKYIEDLLKKYNMTDCRDAKSPLDRSIYQPDDSPSVDETDYRALIGSLSFLVSTVRIDLAFAISWLSRFLDKPTERKMELAKRVLRYLKWTKNYGIRYSRNEDPSYQFFSDSDFSSCPLTRRSVTGMVVFSAGGCILWKSSLQKSTTLSSCESELIALSALAQTAQFIKRLLCSLGIEIVPCLKCDNLATVSLATSESQLHSRLKHVSTKEFYVRELVEAEELTVSHVPSSMNFSDICTKPQNSVVFRNLLKLIKFGPPADGHESNNASSADADDGSFNDSQHPSRED